MGEGDSHPSHLERARDSSFISQEGAILQKMTQVPQLLSLCPHSGRRHFLQIQLLNPHLISANLQPSGSPGES
jgi:hypothetical protein